MCLESLHSRGWVGRTMVWGRSRLYINCFRNPINKWMFLKYPYPYDFCWDVRDLCRSDALELHFFFFTCCGKWRNQVCPARDAAAMLRPDWTGQPTPRRNLANIDGDKQAFLALTVFFLTLRLGLHQDLTDRSWASMTQRHLTPWYQSRRSLTSWGPVNKASPSINKPLGLRKALLSTCYRSQPSAPFPCPHPSV